MKQTDLDPEDARAIGIAFMEALPEDATWGESPVECYIQALNEVSDLRGCLKLYRDKLDQIETLARGVAK